MLSFIKYSVGICVCLFTISATIAETMAENNQPEFGTLTHIRQLKERITAASSYSESLRKDMEDHYITMLNKDEGVKDYVDFYRGLAGKTKEHLLKNAFMMRQIRGEWRLRQVDAALTDFYAVETNAFLRCPAELAYYSLVKTYCSTNVNERGSDYEHAIEKFEQCACSPFELSTMYNNYALDFEMSGVTNRAWELYFRAFKLPNSIDRLDLYASNMSDLMRPNKALASKAIKAMNEYLSTIDDNNQKLCKLVALLNNGFYKLNPRQLRKHLTLTLEALDRTDDQRAKAEASLVIAAIERRDGNDVEAESLFRTCASIASTNRYLYLEARALSGLARLYADSNSTERFNTIMGRLYNVIKTMDVQDSLKAHFASQVAEMCIDVREWGQYARFSDLSVEYDCGIRLTSMIVDSLLDAIDEKFLEKSFFTNIVSRATQKGIAKLPHDEIMIINAYLKMMGEKELAALWAFEQKGFLSQVIEIENDLNRGLALVNPQEILSRLDALEPESFSLNGDLISIDEARLLVLLDKLVVCVNIPDPIGISEVLQKIESISLTTDMKLISKPQVDSAVGSGYIFLGEVQKGVELIEKSLKKLDLGTANMAALYMTLGLGEMLLNDFEKAIPHLARARTAFKELGNKPLYYRASVNLAIARIIGGNEGDGRESEVAEIRKMLEECVDRRTGEISNDDLARAYMCMPFVEDYKGLTRVEKNQKWLAWQEKAIKTTDKPYLLATLFFFSASIKSSNDYLAEDVIGDVEQYFHYFHLFSDAIREDSIHLDLSYKMKIMLFELLEETGDSKRIDYWNKVFEKLNTRQLAIESLSSCDGNSPLLPLMQQVAKYEAAEQIIVAESAKKAEERNRLLIAKAREIKAELEKNFDAARRNLSKEDAERLNALLADNFVIQPDSFGQLSSVLPPEMACLQFLPVGESIIVYIAAKDRSALIEKISLEEKGVPAKQFLGTLIKLRALLQANAPKVRLDAELKKTYDILFADLEQPLSELGVKRLIVNGTGVLRYVPFAALYDGNGYLAERYQITNVTGNDLIRLAKVSANRTATGVNAVVFADPDGSLPAGRKEGEEVSKLFKQNRLLVGDKATLDEFESLVGDVNFVHLATHAVLDSDNPSNSYILFANGKKWRYADMLGFNIKNVDSFVLSACSTADVSEKSEGTEIESMAYQLLRKSPSGSVLASFWKVDDQATSALMKKYYEHIVKSMKTTGRLDRGGALREAQLSLMKDSRTASPYYWAAFALFGDFR